MFRSKKDVDKNVRDMLTKIKNEKERQLRGYSIALQYYNVNEFEAARRYLAEFLAIKPRNPDGHRLLAQVYEGLKDSSKALQAYKTAYEIADTQKGLVLKICELSIENTSDRGVLQYWLDEGEKLFPGHSAIIRLKESLIMTGGNKSIHQMEQFYLEEIKKNPLALSYHVRLVRLYLDWSEEKREQIEEGFNYISKVESRSPFPNSLEWYKLLVKYLEVYDKLNKSKLTQVFTQLHLIILDRCLFLSISCNQRELEFINEPSRMLKKFDHCLVTSRSVLKSNSAFLHHMTAQYYYHAVSILQRKQRSGNVKSDPALVGLLLCLAAMPRFDIMNPTNIKDLKEISQEYARLCGVACCRVSQCSHVLINLAFRNGKWDKFKEKMEEIRTSNGTRQAIGNLVFEAAVELNGNSFLETDTFFSERDLEKPSAERVRECDQELVLQFNEDLHCLLWLFSQPPYPGSSVLPLQEVNLEVIHDRPIGTLLLSVDIIRGLPFTEISNGTLCHLDLVSFIEAAIWCREYEESRLEEIHVNPPHVLTSLSTSAQLEWWTSAHILTSNSHGSHNRRQNQLHSDLQSGLRVLRAHSEANTQYGVLPTGIAVHLARYFMRAASSNDFSHSEQLSLHDRTKLYWTKVLYDITKPSSSSGWRRSLEGELFVVKNWNLTVKETQDVEERAFSINHPVWNTMGRFVKQLISSLL